ncbi:FeoA family protein [Bdellovibrio svalbardensis]|uniref:Ferrous iron transport protein A n=1 Tax=Bdellovibrio svalbardensis TaxID=2972972 RepID=A0ABT6DMU9_9BACT|nr:FeoA family protein [Bdellovibrio svalbardensis]MDG0818197.1 ferrous iron transport protein A [Bdellovibrio svalbardensis]
MTLLDLSLKPGQTVKIQSLGGEDLIRERLHEMGLHAGMLVTILGRAPFGGPLLVRFKTSFLALRNEEAQCATITLK